MAPQTQQSQSPAPVWGQRSVSALLGIPLLVSVWALLLNIPVIGWFLAIFEMFVLRIWNWLHSLHLPSWMESILHFIDRIIEKFVVVISKIIHWLFADRSKSDKKSIAGKR
ncbi:uncharacterized protein LOC108669302 [Hyalella azteca]|uniref:Uncharacterized protein LOC108669302 n=1 Tax=Hyalella azteca TaxID=294128 RepID=A0A8B7NEQ7_HYAAZ|nr:uncharacterized protein LOC108669302 [Hyalella azteca]